MRTGEKTVTCVLAIWAMGADAALASPTKLLDASRADNGVLRCDFNTEAHLGTYAPGGDIRNPTAFSMHSADDVYGYLMSLELGNNSLLSSSAHTQSAFDHNDTAGAFADVFMIDGNELLEPRDSLFSPESTNGPLFLSWQAWSCFGSANKV